jgi:hypothetical protein
MGGLLGGRLRYSAPVYSDFLRLAPYVEDLLRRGWFKENVPDELTVGTTEWFVEHKYPLLHATLMPSLIAWGYGDVDELPIVGRCLILITISCGRLS